MTFTASKSIAGAGAANLVIIMNWLLTLIPGWDQVPIEPKSAIIAILSAALGGGIVYYSPPNRALAETPPTPVQDETAALNPLKAPETAGV